MVIQKTTYKDQVVEYIYNLVLDGIYAPGDQLKESKLAAEMGISRAPVREAMKELMVSGIIEYRPQVGNYIANLNAKQIIDSYTTRGVLEGFSVMTTRDLFDQHDLNELRELTTKMKEAATVGDRKKVVALGDAFHHLLTSKNENVQLAEYCDRLSLKLHVLFFRHWSSLYSPEEIGARHGRIVSALADGEPHAIEQVIRDHYIETGGKIAAISNEL